MTSLADRFKKAFQPGLHTKADLARAAKVKPPSVSDWFAGETLTLKAEPMIRAAIYLGVSPLWLVTGEGLMRTESLRPHWPFPGLDETVICGLDRDDRLRLEGALEMLMVQRGLAEQVVLNSKPAKRSGEGR